MVRSLLPLAVMFGVLLLCGWLIAGPEGALVVSILVPLLIVTLPALPVHAAMRLQGGAYLHPDAAPPLYRGLAALARRAGLSSLPRLYRLRSRAPLALTLGGTRDAAIGVSDSLLQLLDRSELEAVIAHEVAHIAAGDVQLMRIGDLLQRATSLVCRFGLYLAFFLLLFSQVQVSLLVILVLAFAPVALVLLQLALSRGREFSADESAARLTGDPLALAAALHRLEAVNRWTLRRLVGQVSGFDLPSFLRTHPSTEERVQRLRRLAEQAPHQAHQLRRAG